MHASKSSFDFSSHDFLDVLLKNHAIEKVIKSRKSGMEHEAVVTSKDAWEKCMEILDVDADHWGNIVHWEEWYIMDSDGSITMEPGEGRKYFPMNASNMTWVYETSDGASIEFVPATKRMYVSFIWKDCAKGFKISL